MSTAYRKPSIRPAVSSRRIGVIRAHPLWAYFLITYLVTWSYWLVIYGLIGKAGEMWAMPGVFVPALAAVVITGVLGGRSGLRVFLQSWIRWRVSPRWYVFTLVVLPALVLLTYIFLPDGAKGLERGALGPGLTYLATFIVILFVGGGQEEPGWRGFALPRLQEQFGPVPASLALGALWGIWHLPLFILVPNYDNAGYRPGQIATTFIIFAGGFMVGLSLLLTWLFNQTNGSVLLAMLAHASVNTTLGFSPMTRFSTIISFLSILAIGAFIAIATRGRLGYRKQSPEVVLMGSVESIQRCRV